MTKAFWETKSLDEMTQEEWESLCDGCGRCCMQKLQTEHEHLVRYTRVACRLLDVETCRCTDYWHRLQRVPECIELNARNLPKYTWLPSSCAYRRIYEKRGLADWHPLISGDPATVHSAGISMRGQAVSEEYVHADEIPSLIIEFIAD